MRCGNDDIFQLKGIGCVYDFVRKACLKVISENLNPLIIVVFESGFDTSGSLSWFVYTSHQEQAL